MFDTIIKNGNVIDGTGSVPFVADLGLKDGKIQKIEYNREYDSGVAKIYSLYKKINKKTSPEEFKQQAAETDEVIIETYAYKEDFLPVINDWVYSNERQKSDFEIFEAGDKICFIQYCGESNNNYLDAKIRDCIKEKELDLYYKGLKEKYAIKISNQFCNKLIVSNMNQFFVLV